MKKILVIAAHPDDEILGVGATIKKHVLNGDQCYCLILGEGLTSRKSERESTEANLISNLHNNAMASGKEVGYSEMFFSNLPDNRFDSLDMLDIVKIIEKYVEEIHPDVVYTHYCDDLNIDHKITFDAVLTACRPVNDYAVKEIYAFETPSSTEWCFRNGKRFAPNVFIDVKETISSKIKAMSLYETELRKYPHPRSLEALKIIAARWGTVVGLEYVEAFELVRKVK